MKKHLKKTLKILYILLGIFIVCLFSLYIFTQAMWENSLSKEEFNKITTQVKLTNPIPPNLKNTFQLVYPNIFKSNLNNHIWKESVLGNNYQPCPSNKLATYISYTLKTIPSSRLNSYFFRLSLTWELEEHLTQEECWAYLLNNHDFVINIKGLTQLANQYFNKKLENLTIDEQLEIVLLVKNPVVYNKNKHPATVKNKIKALKEKLAITHK